MSAAKCTLHNKHTMTNAFRSFVANNQSVLWLSPAFCCILYSVFLCCGVSCEFVAFHAEFRYKFAGTALKEQNATKHKSCAKLKYKTYVIRAVCVYSICLIMAFTFVAARLSRAVFANLFVICALIEIGTSCERGACGDLFANVMVFKAGKLYGRVFSAKMPCLLIESGA